MEIIEQGYEWLQEPPIETLKIIEQAGRTCYKSEALITDDSAKKFVKMIVKKGHNTVIEHINISARFITNRGVLAELTRHRLSSFSVESTRYVRYGHGMQFIRPSDWDEWNADMRKQFLYSCESAEQKYTALLGYGARPEQAREVLTNALKTEIVMTCNLRELRHILNLRCSKAAHYQIRDLFLPLLKDMNERLPEIFGDIADKYLDKPVEGFVPEDHGVFPLPLLDEK